MESVERERIVNALYALSHALDETNSVIYANQYSDACIDLTNDIDTFNRTLSRWLVLDALHNETDGTE